ncbi:MAG: quinone-dependent dihydroorotate dehydrogenase [Alphaproteobacteria bacterium]
MCDLYKIARPLLFALDPETAHGLAIRALKTGLVPGKSYKDPSLETTLWGYKFANPLGLAAGFVTNAEIIAPTLKLGFGFVEVGTVTPLPQSGNPRPRIFRDKKNEAVINRMGFPNEGLKTFRTNLESFLEQKKKPEGILGINIGMNKDQMEPANDYIALIRMLGPLADYITVNVSSPNTEGLRDLQKQKALSALLSALKEERTRCCGFRPLPILVKIAPDLSPEQQEELAHTAVDVGIDGLVLTNTTLDRPSYLPKPFAAQKGGLSGLPLTARSTEMIRRIYRLTNGQMPLIGVGGISSAQDAYAKIRAGASLVQLYSAFIFKGPALVNSINRDLARLLKEDGYTSISQAVGLDSKP